jgi:hypothetical protein
MASTSSSSDKKVDAPKFVPLRLSASLLINDQVRPRDACAAVDEAKKSFSVVISAEDGSLSEWVLAPRKGSPGQEVMLNLLLRSSMLCVSNFPSSNTAVGIFSGDGPHVSLTMIIIN